MPTWTSDLSAHHGAPGEDGQVHAAADRRLRRSPPPAQPRALRPMAVVASAFANDMQAVVYDRQGCQLLWSPVVDAEMGRP